MADEDGVGGDQYEDRELYPGYYAHAWKHLEDPITYPPLITPPGCQRDTIMTMGIPGYRDTGIPGYLVPGYHTSRDTENVLFWGVGYGKKYVNN